MSVLISVLTLASATPAHAEPSQGVPAAALAPPSPQPAPTATLAWRSGLARVSVHAPTGWHVSPDAPTHLTVGLLDLTVLGDPAGLRFPLTTGTTTQDTSATLDLALCTDDGARCQSWTLRAPLPAMGKRGKLHLVASDTPTVGVSQPRTNPATDTTRDVSTGPGVYDFAAAWCPPCNRLAAELLHDPADAAWRASQPPITRIDADAAASWTLKDRYKVGGYPTLLAVDSEGREVARLVGYPGEEATRAWFAGLQADLPSWKLREVDPTTLSPDTAARAARRLLAAEDADAARRFLPRFANVVSEDAAIARLALAPTSADVAWLVANARPGAWVVDSLAAVPEAWDVLKPLRLAVPATVAADLLAVRADQLDAAAKTAAHAAMTPSAKAPPRPGAPGSAPGGGRASTPSAIDLPHCGEALHTRLAARWLLEGVRTGDLERDRGILADLADLRARTGDLDAADTLLRAAAEAAPDDFSWDFIRARLLVEGERPAAGVEAGERALQRAHDDQRLRAVQPLARALAASGRTPDALARIDEVLATTPIPASDVEVRTHRYIAQVRALREDLAGGKLTPR